jgi:uncharacterized membrane protein
MTRWMRWCACSPGTGRPVLAEDSAGRMVSSMLKQAVDLAAKLFEAGGTLAMTLGVLVAIVRAVAERGGGSHAVFRSFRQNLGRAIILGLELLVAADILRTITTEPTLRQVVVLGIIVLIRTFLSFSLEVELEGRWPWQRLPDDARPAPPK